MRDLINNIDLKRAISPAAAVADNTVINTQILDRIGAEAVALAIILGDLADTDATFAVSLTHGDAADLSDGAAVTADMITGSLTLAGFNFANDNGIRKVGYTGGKRYLRASITPANNTGNAFISAVWLLSKNNLRPTPNPPA